MSSNSQRFGIISDTHGMFRPELPELFSGATHIFHAGDIGKPVILRQLEAIAPVTAVLGNIDIPAWFPHLNTFEITTILDITFLVIHNLDSLDLDPAAAGIDVVIYGHTHRHDLRKHNGVLYINPGSAGPPRFHSTPGIALFTGNEEPAVEFHSF